MYIATAEYDARVTQSDIAAVANRTELTIRNWYQEQEVVLRETEPVPSDAHGAIDYVAERTVWVRTCVLLLTNCLTAPSELTPKRSRCCGHCQRLQRAGELLSDQVGIRMLSGFTPADTDEISNRRQTLLPVVRPGEAQELIRQLYLNSF